METISTVYQRKEPRFNMAGQFLSYPLEQTDETVSEGLKVRLARYAETRLKDIGLFPVSVEQCEVSTMDAGDKPADRAYNVSFTTPQGASIVICNILTKSGWPFLDHGISFEE